jgi:penicillin-binding protein 2
VARAELGALIDELAEVVDIQPRDRRRFKRLLEEQELRVAAHPHPLTDEEVARFTAQRFRFPGVEIKARLFRNYPLGEVGSHLLGYIGRINQAEKKAMEDWDDEEGQLPRHRVHRQAGPGAELRARAARHHRLRGGRDQRRRARRARWPATRHAGQHPGAVGRHPLQALVEQLFGDRRGALVALDPRNGEVLAFVSKPTFDPNLFVDGIDVDSWRELNESHRQAAAQPRAARHLPAGLDLQALHGDGGAGTPASAARAP